MNEILTLIEKVKNDRQNGASHLALQSLEILKTAAYQSSAVSPQLWAEEIIGYGHLLIEARPAMTPISSLVNEFISIIRIKAAGCENEPAALKQLASSASDQIAEDFRLARKTAVQEAATLIKNSSIIMTCSFSSTVYDALILAQKQDKDFRVTATRSYFNNRSYGEMTCDHLSKHQISCDICADNEIPRLAASADMILLGADTVFADGSLINGYPSLKLAQAASEAGTPLFSICDRYKYRDTPNEAETWEAGFEKIDAGLITYFITEYGLLMPSEIRWVSKIGCSLMDFYRDISG